MLFRVLKVAALFFLMILPSLSYSQLFLASYLEVGGNAVYNDSYLNYSVLPSCKLWDIKLKTGFSWTFAGQKENRFEGCFIQTTKDIYVFKKSAFGLTGIYLWKPFSSELREVNWGLMISCSYRHFDFLLGNNHRTYRYSYKSRNLNEFSRESSKITEPWNLIYDIGYSLNNNEKSWNLAMSITNIDYFLINQETNPMVHLKASYSMKDNIGMFLDIWYKSAGMFNMKVNHFGSAFRFGVKWEITDL